MQSGMLVLLCMQHACLLFAVCMQLRVMAKMKNTRQQAVETKRREASLANIALVLSPLNEVRF